jgi:mannose/fructose/N-acetylgalactosamine-specific phosphotransferase system component IIC
MSVSVPGAAELLGTAAVGGLAALDNTAAFQLMLGQPVLAGTAAGALAGDPLLGLETGLTLQLLWSGSSPLGASRFPDAPVGGTAGGAVAALAAQAGLTGPLALAWGLLVGLLAAEAGWWSVSRMRRANVRLLHRADRAAGRGDAGGILGWNLAGALASFARGFLSTLAAVFLGVAGGTLLFARAETVGAGSPAAGAGLPAAILALRLLGIGVLVTALAARRRRDLLYLLAGAGAALVALPMLPR